jgi:phosphoglycolate phosphatase
VVRLILFDIDGTLIRTGGAGVKAFRKVFETEFSAVDGFEKLKFAGRTDFSLVREFFTYHNIAPTRENFDRFFAQYVFWLDHILNQSVTEICEGVGDFIDKLKSSPNRPVLGLLTGNIRLGAEIKLRHVSLWDTFETGGFADDHEHRDQIAAIARQRGAAVVGRELAHDEVLVIGDTPLDIQCARAIKAKVLAVATGGADKDELRAHKPDWAVRDLSEVNVEELRQ